MSDNFRKLRIGFVNLLVLGIFKKEAEEKAVKLSIDAMKYLEGLGVDVYKNLPAVTNMNEAKETWQYFKEKKVDAVVLYNGTFSFSNLMNEIVRNIDCPFLLWGLEEYLINKGIISGSMVGLLPAGPIFRYLKKSFTFVYGTLEYKSVKEKINIFINVLRAIIYLREARVGILGNRPDGFEISGFDELAIKEVFGTTLINISMINFFNKLGTLSDKEIDEDLEKSKKLFDIDKKDYKDVKELSRLYLGIKKMVKDNNIQAYAPQCWPELRIERKTPICVANGRCTSEGIMASCECDMDCTLTMLLIYALTGKPVWTADFVNLIKENGSLLFWHCGNAPHVLSDSKPKIEIVFEGLAQTATLKSGIVTVCRINHYRGSFEMHAAVGEAINYKPLLKGSSMFVKMNCGNMEFMESLLRNAVPHHNVLAYGDISKELKEFSKLMNINLIIM